MKFQMISIRFQLKNSLAVSPSYRQDMNTGMKSQLIFAIEETQLAFA